MVTPFLAVHHHRKSVVLNCQRHLVLKVFRGKTAKKRAEAFAEALRIGWFTCQQQEHAATIGGAA